MDKWAVNGFTQEKWTIEKFREKILQTSEAVAHCRSTDYLFWEFQKNVSALETCRVTEYRPHHTVSLL